MPHLIIIAGSNGSGKTTAAAAFAEPAINVLLFILSFWLLKNYKYWCDAS